MKFQRMLVCGLLLLCMAGAVTAQDDGIMPDFAAMTNPNATEWTTPLLPIFESAAKDYNVPLPLLLTLGYYGSAFENRFGAPTIEYGYGVMALRQNKLGGDSLAVGATLVGAASAEAVQLDPSLNIHAAAAVLDSYATSMKIDRAKGLEAWLEPVIKYAGLDDESSKFFAFEVFETLQLGIECTNTKGEKFEFAPQNIGSVDLEKLKPTSMQAASGYPGATWYPAASCNYSAYYSRKDTVIVHTIEGTAAGCLSWFRNCSANVSAHYVVSKTGGIWQCVNEDYVAWHVSCYNSRSVGLEHEGYAASSSHPQALYDASALCVRNVCDRWGIPKSKRTVGPGILGHIDVTRCCCGTHTDPGNGWDWNYYIGKVQGSPPPPTWSATYKAQSYPSSMVAGSTAIVWAEYTNTGTGTWTHSGTRLGTSSPQDRSSPFYNSANWLSANRPTEVDQSSVAQNQVGRFTFILKAPSTPGTYTEKYRPVQEGVTWFGPEITWTITVTAAKGNITGTVSSSAGGVISGATVAITGGASTTTNTSGVYSFTGVNAGTYTLTASKTGFNPASSSVTVNADATTTKNFTLTPTDTTAPTAPTGLTASAVSPSQINLAWNAATDNVGVTGYKVYRGGSEIGSTSARTFQDNGLPANTAFSYYVKAYDAAGNLSPASNTASATTFPGSVPIFEDGFVNRNYWEDIVQPPMPGAYPAIVTGEKNHDTFANVNSLRTRTSTDPNQGCLIGHRFVPAFGAAKFETYFFDGTGVGYRTAFNGTTDGWVSYPSAYATLSNPSGGQSGSCLGASDGGWTAGVYKEFTSGFAAGETFSLSMYAKWPAPADGKTYTTAPRCFVRFLDGAGAEISTAYSANITTDNVWRSYSVTGTVPAGTARIWIGHWGVLGATQTISYYADTVVFSTNAGAAVKNNSRQGMQIRCLDETDGVRAIYYIGTYSAGGPTGSDGYYSVGYYKVCGVGCTGWYWTYNAKARTAGWHKLTLDFLPYTGSGDVKAYIDGVLVATLDRTPDTEAYGLNMVAYGYHYRVNQESWFDDVAMYASQPHPAPTAGTPVALGADSIRWRFTDNTNNEIGFKAVDSSNAIKAATGVLTGTGSAGSMDETGLAPNTLYTRWIKAYNGSLDSFSSAAMSAWTLSAEPTAASVVCDRAVSVWYNTADFEFTAVGGFGEGTVSGYRYAWDQSPAYAFTGAEPVWDSGNFVAAAASEGEWYLHVQGFNANGVPNGTLDLGPYRFDGTGPQNPTIAVETGGAPDGEWQSAVSDPAFTWMGASDLLSGIGDYLVYFGPADDATSDTAAPDASYDPAAVDTGTYYLRVCARDAAGNQAGEWVTLFTFMYDGSAPDAPSVTDDGDYTGDGSRIHATWYASDADSGVVEYQYAVGTTAGADDVVGWTSADTDEEATIAVPAPGMSLGAVYFVSVKAKNGAGAWSDAGSSDGIQLAPESLTISAAKALADGTPITLAGKTVSALFANSYYIQETDRSSGILVMGAGPKAGSIVTVGGVMGLNAAGERAIVTPVTTVEFVPESGGVPKALLLSVRDVGGADLNAWTFGVTGGVSANNIGLLVTVAGKVVAPDEREFFVDDGSPCGPIKVIATSVDLSDLLEGDIVIVTGISSLELDGETRKPIIRVADDDDIVKRN